MVGRDGKARPTRIGTVLMLTFIVRVEEAFAGGAVDRKVFQLDPAVDRAVKLATLKLASPACQEMFSEFRDAAGRTLRENLDALGQTPEGYLEWTLFYEGYGKQVCDSSEILASTTPGSRVVYICTPQFTRVERRNPGLAAALIIHEEMHSLGLGENPPTSKVITARVIARCGK